MKKFFLLLFLIISLYSNSQIIFEPGYYIDDYNVRVDGLIKNLDWDQNPDSFEFKLTENSVQEELSIDFVKEFGVLDKIKYERHFVNIDRASIIIGELSSVRGNQFTQENLFLKVLVEGESTLYSYKDGNVRRFFYRENKLKGVEPLIFKKYLDRNNNVAQNNEFKQQLWNNLKCERITRNKIKNLKYDESDLVSHFVNFNECKNQEFKNYAVKEKRDLFNLTVRPGMDYASFYIDRPPRSRFITVDHKFSFRFGVEAELILPFNKSKWSIFIEPTYKNYQAEQEEPDQVVVVDYESIEIPIGLRHYFFLNDNSKLFLNAAVVIDLERDSMILLELSNDVEITTAANLAFGLGYKFNNRYSVELRGQTDRNAANSIWDYHYQAFSFIVGYSFF